MKVLILLVIMVLILSGCGKNTGESTKSQLKNTDEPAIECQANDTETEEVTSDLPTETPIVEIKLTEIDDDEQEEEGNVLRYEPDIKVTTEPLFDSGELDLNESTPDELVIKIKYYKDGQPVDFDIVPGHGRTFVKVFKQYPQVEKEDLIRMIDDKAHVEFMMFSSKDKLVIPTYSINSFENETVTIQLSIDARMLGDVTNGSNFGPETLDDYGDYTSIYATIPKTW